jgi:LysR family glycine cleavage system transcriptional activator
LANPDIPPSRLDTNEISEILGSEKLRLGVKKDTPYSRFPSLNALRAFEAAARLGGFAQAADELLVTPGAVAAQIKILEAEFDSALFERHARGVRLTPIGESVKLQFVAAFDALGDAVRSLRHQAAPFKVHIATSPALAQLWLAPRLKRVREILQDVDISVTTLEGPPDLKRGPFDLSLFYTADPEPHQIRLCKEDVFPVCTPAIAQKLLRPADLAHVTCIADVVWEDWTIWGAAGMPGQAFLPRTGPGFSLYAIAVQEALLGLGVLMGRRSLVEPYLASGALVAPFDLVAPLGLTIAIWMLPQSRNSRLVNAVVEILREMA